MSEEVTFSEGGYTVTSSSETKEQLQAILGSDKPADEKPDLSKAASELGKKGGEASAAARKTKDAEGNGGHGAESASGLEHPDTGEPQKGTGEEQAEPEKPLGKPRDDPRARMLEATRKEAEAKRERDLIRAEKDRLAAELEQLRAGNQPKATEQPKAGTVDDPEPELADFDEHADWLKAWKRWDDRETRRADAKEHQERAYHEGIGRAVDSFTSRMEDAQKADPTLAERLAPFAAGLMPSFKARALGVPIGPVHVITDEIINSEIAPALTLHLAEHEDVFQRLLALRSPTEIQLAIAKLEGKLESQSAAPTATVPKAEVSQAKPPVRPVNGSPHTADQMPDDSSSVDDHIRYWNAKERRR